MPWQAELPFAGKPLLAGDEVSRTIALGDRIVPYVLRRSRRRSIGLQIDQRGLRIGAPLRASLSDVETLIRKHGEWVTQKLDEWRSRRQPALITLHDGLQLPVLGQTVALRFATGGNRFLWQDESPTASGFELTLFLRRPEDAGKVLERALRDKASRWFADRLAEFSARLMLTPPPLALSSARTRWGSCSRVSGIRLNWRLIHFPPTIIDYVVAHELAHLKEMNHSARFWQQVSLLFPDYAAARKELNRLAAQCPHWAV